MARLFFALWPGAAARDELARLAAELARASGGRAVPADKIHLTLAFLGEVPPERRGAAIEAANGIARAAFEVAMDRVGSFARAEVAWAGTSRPNVALDGLATVLAQRLRAAAFNIEERRFAAHVTLARRIRQRVEGASIAPIAWQASEIALVESDLRTGSYATREIWTLGTR